MGGLVAIFLVSVVAVGFIGSQGPNVTATPSPGGYVGYGDTASGGQGAPVTGLSGPIECSAGEHQEYHIHAHLFILKDGAVQPGAAYVGFVPGGNCLYWLHTHDQTGVIHIESPTKRVYTLGDFFAVWGMPLGRNGVAQYDVPGGELTVFVDGKQYSGDPGDIQLQAHTQVVIELGTVVQPPQYQFGFGQ